MAARREDLAVGRERHRVDLPQMAPERRLQLAAGRIPEFDRAVPEGGREDLSVGREGEMTDRVAIRLQRHRGHGSREVPDRDGRIGRSRGQDGAVGGEGQSSDLVVRLPRAWRRACRSGSPRSGSARRRLPGGQGLVSGTEGHGVDLSALTVQAVLVAMAGSPPVVPLEAAQVGLLRPRSIRARAPGASDGSGRSSMPAAPGSCGRRTGSWLVCSSARSADRGPWPRSRRGSPPGSTGSCADEAGDQGHEQVRWSSP